MFHPLIKEIIAGIGNKNSFIRNSLLTLTGKSLTILIGFLVTPVISRIFTPENYGYFNLYFSITAFTSVLVTAGYDRAIVLSKNDRSLFNLFVFTSLLIVVNTIIMSTALLFASSSLNVIFNINDPWFFLLYVPLGTIVTAFAISFPQWNIKRKQFGTSASIEFGGKLFNRVYQVFYGLLAGGFHWILITGDIISKSLIVIVRFWVTIFKEFDELINNISFKKIRNLAIEYKAFPIYVMPTQWLRIIGQKLPIFITSYWFGNITLGHFAMATGLINIPFQLLASSMSPVFMEALVSKRDKGDFKSVGAITEKLIKSIFFISIIPACILIVYGEEILTKFLGSNWEYAGKIGSVLSIYLLVFLVTSPAQNVFRVLRRERELFILNTYMLISNSGLFVIGVFSGNYMISVYLFVASNYLWHLIILARGLREFDIPIFKYILIGNLLLFTLTAILFFTKI